MYNSRHDAMIFLLQIINGIDNETARYKNNE